MEDKKHVLIIDDDNRNIFALSAVLKAKGFRVSSATSAVEGIERLRQDPGIKVVLLDIMMPDMDGYQAMAEIRSQEELDDVRIVAVTAQAMVGDKEKTLNAGADYYVSKPVDVDQLLKILKEHS